MGILSNDEILLKIYEEQQLIKKQLEDVPNMKSNMVIMQDSIVTMQDSIVTMQDRIVEMQNIIVTMQGNIVEMQENIATMQSDIKVIQKSIKEIPKIKIELRKISKTVAKIEVEHGEKLQILFDAFKVHDQKIDRIEQKLDNHAKIINRHSDEIFYLKNKLKAI